MASWSRRRRTSRNPIGAANALDALNAEPLRLKQLGPGDAP
jgi:hypothetical protein